MHLSPAMKMEIGSSAAVIADVTPFGSEPSSTLTVDGNRLALLASGPQRLDALIELIDGARQLLRILYYIWVDDRSGRRVRDALAAALDRGVDVSLLVDGFGAAPSRFFEPLLRAGLRFCRFAPGWGRRYLLRNHQKLALADGRRVIVGGFNISDDYFGTAETGAWRDLGLEVEGAGVAPLAGYFDALFRWSQTPGASIRRLRRMLTRHSTKEGALQWLFGGPTRRPSPWARSVRNDMRSARRLDMIMAYFAPGPSMLRAISRVAAKGRARIVTAARSDSPATSLAARHSYWRLLRRGAEIYEYQPARLHTKLIVMDDAVHVGSANFDLRSLYLNLEMMLRVEDARFAFAMRGFIDSEIRDSVRITREVHRARRTWWNRLAWAAAYFIVATADYSLSRRLNFGSRRLGF